jgi:ferritin-like protein
MMTSYTYLILQLNQVTMTLHNYLKIFSEEYLSVNKNSAKLIGHRIRNLNPENVPKNIMLYDKIEDLVKDL